MSIKIVKGDLIDFAQRGRYNAVFHGCNCQNKFGRGVALKIRDAFPSAYDADCRTKKGDPDKLGSYSHSNIILKDSHHFVIYNLYTQLFYGSNGYAEVCALKSCFNMLLASWRLKDKKVGMPFIGCGLGKMDRSTFMHIINKYEQYADIEIVELEK